MTRSCLPKPSRRTAMMRRLAAVLLLAGSGLALGGCVVADGPGYHRPRPYAYGYRDRGPPPGGYYAPRYRSYDGYYRRPYWR